MNRQFKFRAWNIEGKRYTYFDLYDSFISLSSKTFVIQQSTGLKDINGKEIYEGDICFYHNPKSSLSLSKKNVKVIWSEVDSVFMVENTQVFWVLNETFALSQLEVVGNIFESPELELI